MIKKVILALLVAISLLALVNAGTTYQRSFYLERGDRVNLTRLTDNIDQLDRERLLRLSKQIVTISKSDYGVLRLMNREFRRAILWLGFCLSALLLYLVFLQTRAFLRGKVTADNDS